MNECHDVDTCECPAGVIHRVENQITYFAVAAGVASVAGVAYLIRKAVEAVGRAASFVDWHSVAAISAASVIAIVVAFVSFLFLHAAWYDYKHEGKIPRVVRGPKKLVVWIYRKAVTVLSRRDYRKLIRKRPEVASMIWAEMVMDQMDGHPEEEQVTNPEVLRILEKSFATERGRMLDRIHKINLN